jgi:hypothetical protein
MLLNANRFALSETACKLMEIEHEDNQAKSQRIVQLIATVKQLAAVVTKNAKYAMAILESHFSVHYDNTNRNNRGEHNEVIDDKTLQTPAPIPNPNAAPNTLVMNEIPHVNNIIRQITIDPDDEDDGPDEVEQPEVENAPAHGNDATQAKKDRLVEFVKTAFVAYRQRTVNAKRTAGINITPENMFLKNAAGVAKAVERVAQPPLEPLAWIDTLLTNNGEMGANYKKSLGIHDEIPDPVREDLFKKTPGNAFPRRMEYDGQIYDHASTELAEAIFHMITYCNVHGFQYKAIHLFKSLLLNTAISFLHVYQTDPNVATVMEFLNEGGGARGGSWDKYAEEMFILDCAYGHPRMPLDVRNIPQDIARVSSALFSIDIFRKLLDEQRNRYTLYVRHLTRGEIGTSSPIGLIKKRALTSLLGQINYRFYLSEQTSAFHDNDMFFGIIQRLFRVFPRNTQMILKISYNIVPKTFDILPVPKNQLRHIRIDTTTLAHMFGIPANKITSATHDNIHLGMHDFINTRNINNNKIGNSFTTDGVSFNFPNTSITPLLTAEKFHKDKKNNPTVNMHPFAHLITLPVGEHVLIPSQDASHPISRSIVDMLKQPMVEQGDRAVPPAPQLPPDVTTLARNFISSRINITAEQATNNAVTNYSITRNVAHFSQRPDAPNRNIPSQSKLRIGPGDAIVITEGEFNFTGKSYTDFIDWKLNGIDNVDYQAFQGDNASLNMAYLQAFYSDFLTKPGVTSLVLVCVNHIIDPNRPYMYSNPTAFIRYDLNGYEHVDLVYLDFQAGEPQAPANAINLEKTTMIRLQYMMGVAIDSGLILPIARRSTGANLGIVQNVHYIKPVCPPLNKCDRVSDSTDASCSAVPSSSNTMEIDKSSSSNSSSAAPPSSNDLTCSTSIENGNIKPIQVAPPTSIGKGNDISLDTEEPTRKVGKKKKRSKSKKVGKKNKRSKSKNAKLGSLQPDTPTAPLQFITAKVRFNRDFYDSLFCKATSFAFCSFYPLIHSCFVTPSSPFPLLHGIPHEVMRLDLLTDNVDAHYRYLDIRTLPDTMSALDGILFQDPHRYPCNSVKVRVDDADIADDIVQRCIIFELKLVGLAAVPSLWRNQARPVELLTRKGPYIDPALRKDTTPVKPTPVSKMIKLDSNELTLVSRFHGCRVVYLDLGIKDLVAGYEEYTTPDGIIHRQTFSHSRGKYQKQAGITRGRQVKTKMEAALREPGGPYEYLQQNFRKGKTSPDEVNANIAAKISQQQRIEQVMFQNPWPKLQFKLFHAQRQALERIFSEICERDPYPDRFLRKGNLEFVPRECIYVVGDADFESSKPGRQSTPTNGVLDALFRYANPNHVIFVDEMYTTKHCACCGSGRRYVDGAMTHRGVTSVLSKLATASPSSWVIKKAVKKRDHDQMCINEYRQYRDFISYFRGNFHSLKRNAAFLAEGIAGAQRVDSFGLVPEHEQVLQLHFDQLLAMSEPIRDIRHANLFIPSIFIDQIKDLQQALLALNLDEVTMTQVDGLCNQARSLLQITPYFLKSGALLSTGLDPPLQLEEDDMDIDDEDRGPQEAPAARTFDKRGIRYCINDFCENYRVKNRDTNACKNFKLIVDDLMRGHGRPRHLMSWLETHAVPTADYDTIFYERNMQKDAVQRLKPIILRFGSVRCTEGRARELAASELAQGIATLIPIHRYIRKRKGRVRDHKDLVNHLRKPFAKEVTDSVNRYLLRFPNATPDMLDLYRQRITAFLERARTGNDRILASFELAGTRQEIIVIGSFPKPHNNRNGTN